MLYNIASAAAHTMNPYFYRWLGFGVGPSMTSADLTVLWPNSDGTFTHSRRKATSYVMPVPIANQTPVAIDTSSSSLQSSTVQITFTRAQVLSESSLNAQQTQFVWAFSSSKPSGEAYDSTIYKHDSSGPFSLDLTKALTDSSSSDNSTGSFAQGKVGLSTFDQMVIAHAVLMFAAWGILTPLAIFIARFARNLSNWVRIHYSIQIFGTGVLFFTGFWIGYVQSDGSHLKTNHQIVGVVIFVAFFVQVFLGYIIHHFFNPNRTHRPIRNWVHRILGPLILTLSFVQIPLGLEDYGAPMAANIAFYVWLGVLALAFITLTIRQIVIARWSVKSEEDM
ncbi:hypothetical protein BC937DRAFT_94292 [Endogone sp. FLAS-F59071]|nr:hypothetical protein BC937DRAFT_94292 [Endogone sp. FLAS-F59071]|eukprot:RUS20825.1 hypothetical protein BC937DRAFT_94292 [Endogone sp. FLAS-F59071]